MYQAAENRYLEMKYNRCGKSGLLLPQISLGLWQNFGLEKPLDQQKEIITCAFDHGITHFDLANNYGRPAEGKLTLDNDTFENTGKSRFFERRTSRVLY